jgi:hypothetical protein
MKNLYLYLILALIAIYFCCYQYYSYQYYSYNVIEGYRNAKVYVGESPISRHNLIFMNDDKFAINSIYEVGTVKIPYNSKTVSYFDGAYENNYSGYYPGYYSKL